MKQSEGQNQALHMPHQGHSVMRQYILLISELEIKPWGLDSRIQGMEAEWRLKVMTDVISW